MPIGKWIALHDNNDLTQLVIDGNFKPEELLEGWYKIHDEFIQKHGNVKDIEQRAKDKLRAAKLLIKYLKTLDRFHEFEAGILLDEINAPSVGVSMMEEKGYIEEALGFWMDPDKVTVDEYYAKKKQAHRKWQTQSKIMKSQTRRSLNR